MSTCRSLHGKIIFAFLILTAEVTYTVQIIKVMEIKEFIIYPNPFKSSMGHTKIYFKGIGDKAEIRIFNVYGEQVRQINNIDKETTWDIKNDFGKEVSSGVYIFVIKDSKGKIRTGKLAIIK